MSRKALVRLNGTTLFARLALECEIKKSTIFNVDGMSMLSLVLSLFPNNRVILEIRYKRVTCEHMGRLTA